MTRQKRGLFLEPLRKVSSWVPRQTSPHASGQMARDAPSHPNPCSLGRIWGRITPNRDNPLCLTATSICLSEVSPSNQGEWLVQRSVPKGGSSASETGSSHPASAWQCPPPARQPGASPGAISALPSAPGHPSLGLGGGSGPGRAFPAPWWVCGRPAGSSGCPAIRCRRKSRSCDDFPLFLRCLGGSGRRGALSNGALGGPS